MNKKHFVALTIILLFILIAATITITIAQKDETYESFKNYFQEKLTKISQDDQTQFEEFQQLNPADKFLQASKLHNTQNQQDKIEIQGDINE